MAARIVPFFAVLALTAGLAGAETIEPVGQCGGIAPVESSCSFAGTIPARSIVLFQPDAGFTGRITAAIETATGTYTHWCDFAGGLDLACGIDTQGQLAIGQQFVATVTASMFNPADSGDLAPAAAGGWRFTLTSD